jgi:1,2-diacylglycerol 3-beta-glucosyltransferase
VIWLLNVFGLLVTVSFITYVVLIIVPYLRHKPTHPGDRAAFRWHLLIPCRDEASVIGATLARARSTFPDAHVWVVDDDSDDETGAIVSSAAITDDHVHLVRRRRPNARTGKGHALNAAIDELRAWLPGGIDPATVIVGVLDADGVLAANAFEQVANWRGFGNPAVGAVQIRVRMINRHEPKPLPKCGRIKNFFARTLVRMQDLEFGTTIAAMQQLRERYHSAGMGGNGQFSRLSMMLELIQINGSPWHGALLEDYELGVHSRLAGWRNHYNHDTWVEQEALTSLRRLITQRTRWSQGNMQCGKYIPRIMASNNYQHGAAIEAVYFLLLPYVQLIGAFMWPFIIGDLVFHALTFSGGAGGWLQEYWGLPALSFVFGVLPFVIWGPIYRRRCEPTSSITQSIGWGFAHWLYVFNMYVCTVRAFGRLVSRRNGWAKTRRNSEPLTAGVVALDV